MGGHLSPRARSGLALPSMVELGNDRTAIHMDKELELALKVLLKRITAPSTGSVSGTNKFFETANSPFVVTLIGGALVAIISGMLTYCNAENSKRLETHIAELHQKQNFIDSFPSKVEQYMALTHSVRKREIFLHKWQNEPTRDTARYPDGRTFDQTRDEWEQDWRYWIEHTPGSSLALIYTAKLLFKKKETVKKLDEMENSIETYERATEFQELDEAYNRIGDDLSQVISLFASELNEK
jgi:hypothetical protein